MKATVTLTLIDGTFHPFEAETFDVRLVAQADADLIARAVRWCVENCVHAADITAAGGTSAGGQVFAYGKTADELRGLVRAAEIEERKRVLAAVAKMEGVK